jgi:hypothetical protein
MSTGHGGATSTGHRRIGIEVSGESPRARCQPPGHHGGDVSGGSPQAQCQPQARCQRPVTAITTSVAGTSRRRARWHRPAWAFRRLPPRRSAALGHGGARRVLDHARGARDVVADEGSWSSSPTARAWTSAATSAYTARDRARASRGACRWSPADTSIFGVQEDVGKRQTSVGIDVKSRDGTVLPFGIEHAAGLCSPTPTEKICGSRRACVMQ